MNLRNAEASDHLSEDVRGGGEVVAGGAEKQWEAWVLGL